MDTIKTPRGTFRVRFESLEQAKKEGFNFWFTFEGWQIVGNGTLAVAVRKQDLRNVDYKTPDRERGTWLAVEHKFADAPKSGKTASGYGAKLPTSHMLRIGNRWRRVYAICYGNASTCFIMLNRMRYIVDFSL